MKIAVLSICAPPMLDGHLSFPNKADYCRRHGYDFIGVWENASPSRHPSWGKIPLILAHLSDYDYLFWTDADSLITNPTPTLESLVSSSDADLFIAGKGESLNCGQFIVKSTPTAAAFLEAVWGHYPPLGKYWEQSAMIELLADGADARCGCKMEYVAKHLLNSYPSDWRKDHFLCHWPGDPGRVPKMNSRLFAMQAQR